MVAQHAGDRIALAGNARRQVGRRLDVEGLAADLFPALHDLHGIGAQHVGRGAGGGGAQHDAAFQQSLDMAAQPIALGLALDAAREADARADRMVDEVAPGDGDVHRKARPLLALAVVAHLDQERRAWRRPAVEAGAILGAQEARAADADIDEGGIEIGHHPFEPAEEHALDPRGRVAAHDLQLDQAAFGDQRHQECLGQDMTDQPVDLAHGWAAFSRPIVSNSGRPTTLL